MKEESWDYFLIARIWGRRSPCVPKSRENMRRKVSPLLFQRKTRLRLSFFRCVLFLPIFPKEEGEDST